MQSSYNFDMLNYTIKVERTVKVV